MNRRSLTVVPDPSAATLRSRDPGLPALSAAAVRAAQDRGAFVLDLRHHDDFAAGHLAGSVTIGLDDRFEHTCRAVLPAGVDLVLVGSADAVERAARWLTRAGFGPLVGRSDGVVDAMSRWVSPRLDPSAPLPGGPVQIVDVRAAGPEIARPGVVRVPLDELLGRLVELRPDGPTAVVGDGYRSSVVASLLRACGFADVSEMLGEPVHSSSAPARPRLRLLASA
jgi:hydroxyacylglutathione hydrolase